MRRARGRPRSAGCQSTQATSAELAKNADKLVEQDGHLDHPAVGDVKVVSATVLAGEDTSTVAVELENESQTGLINVPIQLDVKDAKGKTLFKNNAAGTDPTLVGVPVIGPGEDVWWVHDQIFAPTGEPDSVKVEVGEAPEPFPEIPEVEVVGGEGHQGPGLRDLGGERDGREPHRRGPEGRLRLRGRDQGRQGRRGGARGDRQAEGRREEARRISHLLHSWGPHRR